MEDERADRKEGRRVDAWQLVTTNASGNSGKIAALEYLNSIKEPLIGIDLGQNDDNKSRTYLRRILSSSADLTGADLAGADLNLADLNLADLNLADLSQSYLSWADLREADLVTADLTEADLGYADLTQADLSKADLRWAKYLTQEQMNVACGDEQTRLPEGLKIPMCSEVDWYDKVHGNKE